MAQAGGTSSRGVELIGRSIADDVPDSGGVWLGAVWIGFGAGVPTLDAPDGSIFLSTTNGLYVRQSGNWVGK